MTPTKAIQGRAYGACPIQHAPAEECSVCDVIADEMQAAVDAERERIKRIMADDYDACLDFPPKIKLEYFAILRLMELRIDAGDWR